MTLTDVEFLTLIRQALLLMVDAIERKLGMPRTAELRREKRGAER
jgi:hypothetical protein